jgi:hypothetical protein
MTHPATPTSKPTAAEIVAKATLLSAILIGGAIATYALVEFLTREEPERVGVGGSGGAVASVEEWLRHTASRLKQGSRDILASVDPGK